MINEKNNSSSKIYVVPIILIAILWIIFFLPAFTVKYWQGWILWANLSLVTLFITLYFSQKNPEFLGKRTNVKEKDTSKKAPGYFKLFYLGFILPGLDFHFQWSKEPLWLIILANLLVFGGYIFIFLVFRENTFASTVIKVENKQQVVTSGPYSIVRHPMYLGMVIMSLFIPLAMGSYFALIPMLFIFPITLFRIKNEEALLSQELPGYKEYCQKTPKRLIPFIW